MIDRKNTGWAIATVVMAAVAVGVYVWDSPHHIHGQFGKTPVGLTLGAAALLFMLYGAALGLKRRVPHWRLGKAQTWMRGHIWMGLLVCLLVALHGAFKTGGPLTTWLWILLAIVTVSGLLGLVIQQMVPSLLLHSVPGETVAQQLARQIAALPELAERVVKKYSGSVDQAAPPWSKDDAAAKPPAGGEPLRLFYLEHVGPFLRGTAGAALKDSARSDSLFEHLRTSSPPHIQPGVESLEELCDRRRQLLHQKLLMRTMTFWLIVHVPLSWTLLILTFAHAVVALRY